LKNGLEIDIKKQYLKRGKGDMESPQKVSLDVMKDYAGLQMTCHHATL
jgi:hypothetical protein